MTKKPNGFTLVELMITMVIFVLAIAAVSSIFSGLLNQFKQQSKIAETSIEGVIGLQMLKSDMEQAGYGLPYDLGGITYSEAATAAAYAAYNDSSSNPPRAIVASDNNGVNGSDIFAVKATNVATNDAAHKWAYIANTSNTGANFTLKSWTESDGTALADDNFKTNERVIVLKPATKDSQRVLVSSGTFYTTFNSSYYATPASFPAGFSPASYQTHLVYGIGTADPRMPFNRADYYIVSGTAPLGCAPGTGVLVKSVIEHATGTRGAGLPLLDCVADMQITLGLDMSQPVDGAQGTVTTPEATRFKSSEGASIASITAALADAASIRQRLKEIRVYILAHEGQRDTSYTHAAATINIVDPDIDAVTPIKSVNLNTVIGPTYTNYRWKLYTLVIKPYNMR